MPPLRKSFQERFEELERDLNIMCNKGVETVERTRKAVLNQDFELAREIIDGDDDLDAFIIQIEEKGIEVLALQAPVAIDLRRIFVMLRIAMHIERVGDLCVNICKVLLSLKGYSISPNVKDNFSEMFKRAIEMLRQSLESFKNKDSSHVSDLTQMDDKVDRIHRAFLEGVNGGDREEVEVTVRVLMIARFVERIADHAVDIGEDVKYMVIGRFVE